MSLDQILLLPPGYGFDSAAWTPASLSSLTAWFDPSYGVYSNSAAKFVAASSQKLSRTGMQVTGAYDWTLVSWANPDTNGPTQIIFGETSGGGGRIEIVFQVNAIKLVVFDGGSKVISHTVTVTAGTWYFIAATYATATKALELYVDGVSVGTLTLDANPTSGGVGNFVIGDGSEVGYGAYGGRVDSCAVYRTTTGGGGCLGLSQIAALYNSGSGLSYSDLSTAQKVGLWSWYDFATTASLVTDAHGSNTLTNTNSVTCDAGIVAGECAVDDPVYRWYARNNAAIYAEQATLANRPIYRQGANGKYYLEFDGTNDHLLSNLATQFGDFTCATLYDDSGAAGAYERIVDKGLSDGFWLGRESTTVSSWGGGLAQPGAPYGVYIAQTDGAYNVLMATRSGTLHVITDGNATSTSQTVTANVLDTTALHIGCAHTLSGFLSGSVAGVVVSSACESNANLLAMRNYLLANAPT